MRHHEALAIAIAAAAAAIVAVFLVDSFNREIVLHGPDSLQRGVAQLTAGQSGFLRSSTLALIILLSVRKFWSIVTFTALGFFVSPIFRVRSPGRVALFVFAFSLVIEILQHVAGETNDIVVSAFDVAIGFFGGWAGAALWNWLTDAPTVAVEQRESFEP